MKPIFYLSFVFITGFFLSMDASKAQSYLPNGKQTDQIFGALVECNDGDFIVFKKPDQSTAGLLSLKNTGASPLNQLLIPATVSFTIEGKRFSSITVDSSMYSLRIEGDGHGLAQWKRDDSEAPPPDAFGDGKQSGLPANPPTPLNCHFQPYSPDPTGFSAGNFRQALKPGQKLPPLKGQPIPNRLPIVK